MFLGDSKESLKSLARNNMSASRHHVVVSMLCLHSRSDQNCEYKSFSVVSSRTTKTRSPAMLLAYTETTSVHTTTHIEPKDRIVCMSSNKPALLLRSCGPGLLNMCSSVQYYGHFIRAKIASRCGVLICVNVDEARNDTQEPVRRVRASRTALSLTSRPQNFRKGLPAELQRSRTVWDRAHPLHFSYTSSYHPPLCLQTQCQQRSHSASGVSPSATLNGPPTRSLRYSGVWLLEARHHSSCTLCRR